ncbi:hypothetical protein GCM10009001_33770 [Virgibacillus siamensis]|uniref:Sporulation lipoprotein YhcN/YlaJ (Spore_YhcN_YlaJ) n=1 Tax=Virgibacillus siamensis TaxID=480071 RepID=A0ABP3RN92_9BACI
MSGYRLIIMIGLILFLTSCSTMDNSTTQEDGINLSYITSNHTIDQHASNKAKEMLRKHNTITSIHAVNTDQKMLIAVEVHHRHRFRLANIRKDLQKEMVKAFPDKEVELSTDKKVVIELNRLEKSIDSNEMNKKKLKMEMNQLIKLMHEQT